MSDGIDIHIVSGAPRRCEVQPNTCVNTDLFKVRIPSHEKAGLNGNFVLCTDHLVALLRQSQFNCISEYVVKRLE